MKVEDLTLEEKVSSLPSIPEIMLRAMLVHTIREIVAVAGEDAGIFLILSELSEETNGRFQFMAGDLSEEAKKQIFEIAKLDAVEIGEKH